MRDARGASFVEHLILVGLVAVACIAGYRRLGAAIDGTVKDQAACVATLACAGVTASDVEAEPPDRAGRIEHASTAEGAPGGVVPVVSNFFGGMLVDGLWGDLVGIGHMVADLPGTAVSLWNLGRMLAQGSPVMTAGVIAPNPLYDPEQAEKLKATAQSIWASTKDYFQNETDRAVGRTVYEILTIVVAPLKVAKAGKATKLVDAAKVAEVADVAKVGEVAKVADDVAEVADAAGDLGKAARAAEYQHVWVNARGTGTYPWRLIERGGGRVVQSGDDVIAAAKADAGGEIVFVKMKNGELRVGPKHMGHDVLSGGDGAEVMAAGEAAVDVTGKGKGKYISDQSGTYFRNGDPHARAAMDAARAEFEAHGVEFDRYKPPE